MKRETIGKNKLAIFLLIYLFVFLMSVSTISALNAKIGNGKVVLYAKVGDVIEKSVKVINDNNVTVNIELIGDGDLGNQIKFKKANFSLAPQEEMDARYTLKVTKEGKTTSYVNVKFTSVGEKNGIILPASVIIFAQKNNGTIDNNINFTYETNNNSSDGGNDSNNTNTTNPVAIGLVITAVVFVILLISLYIYSKKKKNINQKKK